MSGSSRQPLRSPLTLHVLSDRGPLVVALTMLVSSMSAQVIRPATTPTPVVTSASKRRSEARAALRQCRSIPNGGKQHLNESDRAVVCLPSKVYPKDGFTIVNHGATAGSLTSPEEVCRDAGDDCWGETYQFEVEGWNAGSVEFVAKSAVAGVSDYRIEITVEPLVGICGGNFVLTP
jgi:hypothetical protein